MILINLHKFHLAFRDHNRVSLLLVYLAFGSMVFQQLFMMICIDVNRLNSHNGISKPAEMTALLQWFGEKFCNIGLGIFLISPYWSHRSVSNIVICLVSLFVPLDFFLFFSFNQLQKLSVALS